MVLIPQSRLHSPLQKREESGAQVITTNITVSGSTTPNLKLSADRVTTNDVKCKISQSNSVLNKADADGNTVLSAGTLDSGLVTKTVNFEVISETNKSISNVNTEIVDDKDSKCIHIRITKFIFE